MDEIYEDIDLTIEIDEIEKELKKNKSVAMVGLGDSIGFTTTDHNYLDNIVKSINFECKYDVFNSHFYINDTEEQIEDIILSNVTLDEIRKINNNELAIYISEKLAERRIPDDKKIISLAKMIFGFKDRSFNGYCEKISLADVLKRNNCANVFYSVGNDAFQKQVPSSFIQKQQKQREINYDHILSMNPNSTIYAIGLVTPNNHVINNDILDNIKRQNEFYQELATKYGMAYISTKGLEKYLVKEKGKLHLTYDGICILKRRCIKEMYSNLGNIPTIIDKKHDDVIVDDSISYMICKCNQRIENYNNDITFSNYYTLDSRFNSYLVAEEKEKIRTLKK